MKAYNQGINKAQFLAEIAMHQQQDNFIQGTYGDDSGKGCAVGCSIMSINKLTKQEFANNNHKCYEEAIGVPQWLAALEDTIFEGLSLDQAKLWPYKFSEAIQEGAELDKLKVPFICFVLEQNIATMQELLKTARSEEGVKRIEAVIAVNEQMIAAQLSGDEVEIKAASEAASWAASEVALEAASETASRAASEAARAVSRAALEVAWAARAASGAVSGAVSWAASGAASWAASGAARAASRAAGVAMYTKFADKLLELLRSYN